MNPFPRQDSALASPPQATTAPDAPLSGAGIMNSGVMSAFQSTLRVPQW